MKIIIMLFTFLISVKNLHIESCVVTSLKNNGKTVVFESDDGNIWDDHVNTLTYKVGDEITVIFDDNGTMKTRTDDICIIIG